MLQYQSSSPQPILKLSSKFSVDTDVVDVVLSSVVRRNPDCLVDDL